MARPHKQLAPRADAADRDTGYVARALDAIRLAATETPGAVGGLARIAGVNIDTARRLVREQPSTILDLERLELAALKILGPRAPVAGPTDPARAGATGETHG